MLHQLSYKSQSIIALLALCEGQFGSEKPWVSFLVICDDLKHQSIFRTGKAACINDRFTLS